MTSPSRNISISIERKPEEVYQFASNRSNLSKWAHGLVDTKKVHFVEKNDLGVLDHFITVASGETFFVAMRVIPNREGSEVVFTAFKHPGISDEDFLKDCFKISEDLSRLKHCLEDQEFQEVSGNI